jgi:hypothetical protein
MWKSAALVFCAVSLAGAAEIKLGKPLTLKQATPVADLLAEPDKYVGKTVQAKGKVTEVCQNMGCWMNLADENGKMVRIKVQDGVIVFPKESVGKTALAEGKFAKLQLSKEQAIAQAKHEAEENNRPFDPARITGPKTVYQIQGEGAVILP